MRNYGSHPEPLDDRTGTSSASERRARIRVTTTAVEVRGHMSLGNEPKTARSKRTVPVTRSVMRQLKEHLLTYVGPEADALVFTAPRGGPLAQSLLGRRAWEPAVEQSWGT